MIYKNAWTGIDIQYIYDGYSIKENIIVNKEYKQTKFEFAISGGMLSNSKEVKEGIDIRIEIKICI